MPHGLSVEFRGNSHQSAHCQLEDRQSARHCRAPLSVVQAGYCCAVVEAHSSRSQLPAPKRHFHCCGNIDNFLESFRKLELASYDFMGEMVDLERAKRVLEGTYISRLLDFRLVRDLAEDRLTEYLLSELETGSRGGNFGIVLEGQLGVPLSRARMVRDVIAKWNGGTIATFDTLRDYNR